MLYLVLFKNLQIIFISFLLLGHFCDFTFYFFKSFIHDILHSVLIVFVSKVLGREQDDQFFTFSADSQSRLFVDLLLQVYICLVLIWRNLWISVGHIFFQRGFTFASVGSQAVVQTWTYSIPLLKTQA